MRRMFSQPASYLLEVPNAGEGAQEIRQKLGLPAWKRALDLIFITAVLPGAALLGLAVAIAIKVGSKGPVLFKQQRVGYKGGLFTCFKFRTMHVRAETSSHRNYTRQLMKSDVPMTKLDSRSDPRLIPFGAIIRATGLDELPQLINVFLGEMSLVGPRPCIPYEYDAYQTWQRRRFDAFPGLTGLWQVNGKNKTTFNQMIQMDIEYAERSSLLLDLQIIAMTIPAILKQCSEVPSRKRRTVSCPPTEIAKPVHTRLI
jgi:lipopolysaccharide/colanic/teichoic acid biosynthesis glycosyltransferase